MSLSSNVASLATRVGTEIKSLWTAVNAKAPLSSPALTGTPTAPTPSAADNSTKIATTAYVESAVASVSSSGVADLSVTTAKLADSSVTSGKIADGTIVDGDVSASAAISQSKIANLTTDLAAKASSTDLSTHESDTTSIHGIADTSLLATQTYADSAAATAAAAVVNSAPATLDTLNELAMALGNDANFSSTTATALGNRVRVDAAQSFTGTEKTQARSNIDAASSSDSRFTDARTPTSHASTHGSAGSDPVTVSQSQVTDLSTDLAAKASLASPGLTGVPTAPTAAVGTNSTQIATTAYVRAELTYETTTDLTVTTNSTSMSLATGNVGFVASGPTANWTVNFTNVPAVDGQTITATIFVTQGATGYIPATVQIAGASQTIRWQGGSAPTPTSIAGEIDVFSFSMIRRGGTWTVLGSSLVNF